MEFNIRPIKSDDAADLNEMRLMSAVRESVFGMPSERTTATEEYIKSLSRDVHVLVAEVQINGGTKLAACSTIKIDGRARSRHTAAFDMHVRTDFQGMGLGSSLMKRMTALADDWLVLKRLEMMVFADDKRAVNFYRSWGFENEGLLRSKVFHAGEYRDLCMMGRIRLWKDL